MHILLLRGINVGGHNKLPMAELKDILTGLGARNVQIYIQSGNAVLQGDIDADAIAGAIEVAKGFRPEVMLLSLTTFKLIACANPFPDAEGKALHISFLSAPPNFDTAKADSLAIPSERYHVTSQAIYLHAPDGIGRSKLAAAMENLAGVSATARNWNTVVKLLALANP
jgi:uncharacterized protein (DUF1697 family)